MAKPEHNLYRSDQIKACEQTAITQCHVNEMELMIQAGTDAYYFIRRFYPKIQRIAVFCGGGNNAGDGYILARLAEENGLSVIIYQCKPLQDLPSTAHNAALMAIACGVECQSAEDPIDEDVELIVDALLGTGLTGAANGLIADAIGQINASGLPVVALDIPSGLNPNTGVVESVCVNAEATITFIAPKLGMYTADGPDHCGEIHCRSLHLDSVLEKITSEATVLNTDELLLPLTPRKRNSHKNDYGHVLVLGGGMGMPGAVALVAKAAMRTGAGAVSVAMHPDYAQSFFSNVPEAMVWGVETAKDLEPLFAKATICVIGPGLGESEWAKTIFLAAMTSQLPMVIDASALRLLAAHPQMDDNWILTPHPGEAASLLSCSTEEIQHNRYESASSIQLQYGGVVVLKGNGTILRTLDKQTLVCPKGNPGMASAGMGDVLSGIIAGLYAQGLSLSEAAKTGVWAHALVGDRVAALQYEVGILASDLMDFIPRILCGR